MFCHKILNIIYDKNETFVWFDKIGGESDDFDALGKYKNSLFKSSIVIFSLFDCYSDSKNFYAKSDKIE